MKIFKKIMLSIMMFFMCVSLVSACQDQFFIQIRNKTSDYSCDVSGEILVYCFNGGGSESISIIRQESVSYNFANLLIRALNIHLTSALHGTPVDLPITRKTEKGLRIYNIVNLVEDKKEFQSALLREFKELKKSMHILIPVP